MDKTFPFFKLNYQVSEFFLVHIFLYSKWKLETQFLDTFHAVYLLFIFQRYLNKYSYGNAKTRDLFDILTEVRVFYTFSDLWPSALHSKHGFRFTCQKPLDKKNFLLIPLFFVLLTIERTQIVLCMKDPKTIDYTFKKDTEREKTSHESKFVSKLCTVHYFSTFLGYNFEDILSLVHIQNPFRIPINKHLAGFWISLYKQIIGNKVKKQLSKRVLQENKAHKSFRKTKEMLYG